MQTIQAALGLVTSAIGLTGQATDTVAAIKKLGSSDIESDNEEAQQLLNRLATDLTAANMLNVQLSEALKALSNELAKEDEFSKQKARYEVVETYERDTVYRLKESMSDGEPIHHVCPVCLNSEKLFIFLREMDGTLFCQKDSKHFFNHRPSRGFRL